MDLKKFKTQLTILDKTEGGELRKKYIEKFVNTNHELYPSQIKSKQKFLDGYCYLGYLWDYILDAVVVDMEFIKTVSKEINKVYVFWDIHSCERILIKNYWKFDKDDVLQIDFKTLMKGEEFLPEDIYIFDENITWTLIKTHEDINGNRYCLKSGEI